MTPSRRQFLAASAAATWSALAARTSRGEDDAKAAAAANPERPLAERLAAYAHDLRYEDLDAATVERVKTLVIDTLGCGIGAWDERPVRICRAIALSTSGPATVLGTRRRSTVDLAAFANVAATRYLDFNDAYVGKFAVHPSDSIAACLAVAEAERASARELITSIVVAYEVNCRLVDAIDISKRGFDPSVCALPSVALAAGRLMKLAPAQLTHAVNIAMSDHMPLAQTRVGALSDWKGLAVAEAARNAVFAVRLARAGITGPAPIFEGESGFFARVSGPASVDVDSFGRRDRPFRIHQCGMKPYPAVIYTQTAIVAAIEVAKEAGAPDRIASVEIGTTSRGFQRTGSEPEKWAPQTRETADHSMPYIVARAMFDGTVTHESFAEARFRDPAVLAFMRKITVAEAPELNGRGKGAVPTRVTATLTDGRRIAREVDHAPGFAERPMTRADVEAKFRGNVGHKWSRARVDSVLKDWWSLDRVGSLAGLLGRLVLPGV